MAKHCSFTERRAADAERVLTRVKLLNFMAERIGEELEVLITGVESFGIFCRGLDLPVEGLLHITALDANDYFDYDRATMTLTGRGVGEPIDWGTAFKSRWRESTYCGGSWISGSLRVRAGPGEPDVARRSPGMLARRSPGVPSRGNGSAVAVRERSAGKREKQPPETNLRGLFQLLFGCPGRRCVGTTGFAVPSRADRRGSTNDCGAATRGEVWRDSRLSPYRGPASSLLRRRSRGRARTRSISSHASSHKDRRHAVAVPLNNFITAGFETFFSLAADALSQSPRAAVRAATTSLEQQQGFLRSWSPISSAAFARTRSSASFRA